MTRYVRCVSIHQECTHSWISDFFFSSLFYCCVHCRDGRMDTWCSSPVIRRNLYVCAERKVSKCADHFSDDHPTGERAEHRHKRGGWVSRDCFNTLLHPHTHDPSCMICAIMYIYMCVCVSFLTFPTHNNNDNRLNTHCLITTCARVCVECCCIDTLVCVFYWSISV